jgi:GGDEF domain-containing protein
MIEEIQTNLARRYAMGKISDVISSTARRPDLVMKHNQLDRFILLCPETTIASSEILRERIQSEVKTSLGVSISIGVASFPDDALTFDELLRKASARIAPAMPEASPADETQPSNP